MKKHHDIRDIRFDGDVLICDIDGKTHSFELSRISLKLLQAAKSERERFEISPSGYGIHWPALDEDLSIDGLLGIRHRPEFRKAQAD